MALLVAVRNTPTDILWRSIFRWSASLAIQWAAPSAAGSIYA